MKTLQNNFTNPEQSKRLLELGVPADSADCVLENLDTAENDFSAKDYTRWIIEERHVKADIFTENNKGIFLPCWSVGRLIEIFMLVQDDEFCDNYIGFTTDECIHNLVDTLMEYFADNEGMFDFSKLKE